MLEKSIRWLTIIIGAVGFFVAIIAVAGLAEVDVTVDFFGYFIKLESDTFGGSSFMVFFIWALYLW